MRCRSRNLAVVDPFRAVRSQFSRQLGVPADSRQGIRVTESSSEVMLSLDLPGVDQANIQITMEDGLLTISGSREVVDFPGGQRLLDGLSSGDFQKSFRLHESLDYDSVDAVMDLGVLTLTIPKRPESQPKKVTIRTGTSGANAN